MTYNSLCFPHIYSCAHIHTHICTHTPTHTHTQHTWYFHHHDDKKVRLLCRPAVAQGRTKGNRCFEHAVAYRVKQHRAQNTTLRNTGLERRSSVYTIQPCTSLQCHFIQSHIGRVYVYLAVTCHLHFWGNNRDLLRATAVTRKWNGDRNKKSAKKVDPGEENFPAAPAGIRTRDLSITSPAL